VNKETYAFDRSETGQEFLFVSSGHAGDISKMVFLTPVQGISGIGTGNIYNLAFGDLKKFNDEWRIDDSVRSNNGDMPKILATVIKIALMFMKENRNATLTFEGYMDSKSTELGRNQRNILYQRAINSNWDELSSMFVIKGVKNYQNEDYVPGENYDAILITHK
jgi:hypothetical protein